MCPCGWPGWPAPCCFRRLSRVLLRVICLSGFGVGCWGLNMSVLKFYRISEVADHTEYTGIQSIHYLFPATPNKSVQSSPKVKMNFIYVRYSESRRCYKIIKFQLHGMKTLKILGSTPQSHVWVDVKMCSTFFVVKIR